MPDTFKLEVHHRVRSAIELPEQLDDLYDWALDWMLKLPIDAHDEVMAVDEILHPFIWHQDGFLSRDGLIDELRQIASIWQSEPAPGGTRAAIAGS